MKKKMFNTSLIHFHVKTDSIRLSYTPNLGKHKWTLYLSCKAWTQSNRHRSFELRFNTSNLVRLNNGSKFCFMNIVQSCTCVYISHIHLAIAATDMVRQILLDRVVKEGVVGPPCTQKLLWWSGTCNLYDNAVGLRPISQSLLSQASISFPWMHGPKHHSILISKNEVNSIFRMKKAIWHKIMQKKI